MISSTALDLPKHRREVANACLREGIFPIGMENLPARDADAIRVSMEMVDKADIYVGIFAWRYGHRPEDHDISITEMEFNRAVDRKIPILVFLIHKDHPLTIEMVEADTDAQQKLAELKERASKGRGRREFKSPEDLRGEVIHALSDLKRREQEGLGQRPVINFRRRKSTQLKQPESVPCPYRGLEPFTAEHAAFYFGREQMVQRLAAKLKDRNFIALVGPSGCGKSSLVRAGLVTHLQNDGLLEGQAWSIRFFRPSIDPLRVFAIPLISLIEPDATEVTRMEEERRLADHLRNRTLAISDVAARLREKQHTVRRVLLVVDQFEELYTECRDEGLRQLFTDTLLETAAEGITIVITLRADFYGHALANRRLGEAIDLGMVNVLPMNLEEFRDAIEKPASKTGRVFDAGLVDRIMGDVAGRPGPLPLLEFALTELWERQSAEGVLPHAAYDAIGGVTGALAKRAEDVFKSFNEEQKTLTRNVMVRLTGLGEGTEDTRRPVRLDELTSVLSSGDLVKGIVHSLVSARLVTATMDDRTGVPWIEVSHED